MNRTLRRLVVGTVVLATVAGACGSDDTASTDDTASATETTAAEPTPTTETTPTTDTAGSATTEAAAGDAGWDEVVAAAEEEGKVVLYAVMVPDVNERLVAAFSERYPNIEIELLRVMANDLDAMLDAEESTGTDGADVVANVNYPWALAAAEDGRLIEFVGPEATGPDWAGTDYLVDNSIQYSTFANLGVAWNTQEFPDGGPTQYADLLDPAYAGGKIGLVDAVAPVLADFYATLEDLEGEDFLEQLAAQDPVFFPSAVPLEQALAAGEISVAGYATNQGITTAAADGAPVEFASPGGAWVPPIMSYIPAWVKRPNAAQVLIDFMASPEGQEVLGQGTFSPVPDVPGTFGSIEGVSVSNVSRAVEPGWYDEYYGKFNSIFGR
jgi:iron(III) transport system substrate-binding protein